jgi:O-antigen/teichoic acid export membrane protein
MLSAAASHISSTLLLLIATPFLLRAVGLEVYGFWALLGSVSKYCAIANFGIGPALTKYAAEYLARGEPEKIRQITTFGTLFYLGIGLISVPVVMLVSPRLVPALHLSPGLAAIAPGMLVYFAVFSACSLASTSLPNLLIGLGQFDTVAGIGAVTQVAFLLLAAILLVAHQGLMALVISGTAAWLLSVVLCYIFASRELGQVFTNPFTIRLAMVKPLFKVGGWIQLSSAMILLLFETQLLLVSLYVGVQVAALYDVGSKLARGVRALSYYFNTATLPLVSTLEAESGRARAESIFGMSARYVGFVSFATMGLLIVSSPLVVALWLGNRYGGASPTVLLVVGVLSITYVIDNITAVGITIRRGLGATRMEAVYTATAAITSILIGVSFAPKFGVGGIVWGTALGTSIGSVAFLSVFTRVHHVHIWNALLSPMLRLLACTLFSAGAFWLVVKVLPTSLTGSRIGMIVTLLLGGAAYAVALVAGLRITRFFDGTDLALIERSVPARVGRFFRVPVVRALFAAG